MSAERLHDDRPHLRTHRAIGAGLGEVVYACCAGAVEAHVGEPEADRVHRARRLLKRARAVLRIGEALEVAGAATARRRVARCGRELAGLRDAAIAMKLASNLAPRVGGREQRTLEAAQKPVPVKSRAWWTQWRRRLEGETRRIARLDWGDVSAGDLVRALHESALRVRKRAKKTRAKPGIGRAHRWRKALIVLREQVAVMRPVLGDEIAAGMYDRLDELVQRLGKATDYNVLVSALRQRGANGRASRLGRQRRKRAIKRARKRWPSVKRLLAEQR